MSTRDGLPPPSVDIGATLDDGPFTTMQRCVVLLAALAIVLDGFDGQLIGFAVAFAGSVVVARLLSPAEMGIFAIAAALIGIIGVLTSFDISSYVVREGELSPERFDSAFTVNAALALALAAVIFAASFVAGS